MVMQVGGWNHDIPGMSSDGYGGCLNKVSGWKADAPELGHEGNKGLSSPRNRFNGSESPGNVFIDANIGPSGVVESGRIQVGRLLDLPEGFVLINDIKKIKDLIGTLEKGNNEVRLESLNSIYSQFGMRSLLSVTDGRIRVFMDNHYNDLMKLLNEYENALTFFTSDKDTTGITLSRLYGEIKYKLAIFYSLI